MVPIQVGRGNDIVMVNDTKLRYVNKLYKKKLINQRDAIRQSEFFY